MSSKKKQKPVKAQANHEELPTAGENHEVIPSTIVEGTESEIFPKTVGQQTQEQSAPKPQRVSKRPYIPFVAECLEKGIYDRKELLNAVLEKFQNVTKGGVSTFITDLRNPKYSHFKDRKVALFGTQGKLIFEDKIAGVTEVLIPGGRSEVHQLEEPTEKPSE